MDAPSLFRSWNGRQGVRFRSRGNSRQPSNRADRPRSGYKGGYHGFQCGNRRDRPRSPVRRRALGFFGGTRRRSARCETGLPQGGAGRPGRAVARRRHALLAGLSHRNLVPIHEVITHALVGRERVAGFATAAIDGVPLPIGLEYAAIAAGRRGARGAGRLRPLPPQGGRSAPRSETRQRALESRARGRTRPGDATVHGFCRRWRGHVRIRAARILSRDGAVAGSGRLCARAACSSTSSASGVGSSGNGWTTSHAGCRTSTWSGARDPSTRCAGIWSSTERRPDPSSALPHFWVAIGSSRSWSSGVADGLLACGVRRVPGDVAWRACGSPLVTAGRASISWARPIRPRS